MWVMWDVNIINSSYYVKWEYLWYGLKFLYMDDMMFTNIPLMIQFVKGTGQSNNSIIFSEFIIIMSWYNDMSDCDEVVLLLVSLMKWLLMMYFYHISIHLLEC